MLIVWVSFKKGKLKLLVSGAVRHTQGDVNLLEMKRKGYRVSNWVTVAENNVDWKIKWSGQNEYDWFFDFSIRFFGY